MLMKSIEARRRLMVYEILDRQKACNPDMKTAFSSFDDAFERLSVFQTFDTKLPNEKDVGRCETNVTAKHVK